MRAGNLNHRVAVLKPVRVQDATGQEVVSWSEVGQRWANVKTLGGRELMYARQAQSRTTHTVTLRYDPDIDATHKVKLGDRTMNIESVTGDNVTQTVLNCIEVVGE